jgi:hypothetical protein
MPNFSSDSELIPDETTMFPLSSKEIYPISKAAS